MTFTKPIRVLLATIVFTGLLAGCQLFKVDPGSDPLVVNCERVEGSAKATFELVVHVDDSDRGFWRTNAPAFHQFCEWLRVPMMVNQTNYPRGLAMIQQLDNVKESYKAGKATSNTVNTLLFPLQTALNEASAWSVITSTNRSN